MLCCPFYNPTTQIYCKSYVQQKPCLFLFYSFIAANSTCFSKHALQFRDFNAWGVKVRASLKSLAILRPLKMRDSACFWVKGCRLGPKLPLIRLPSRVFPVSKHAVALAVRAKTFETMYAAIREIPGESRPICLKALPPGTFLLHSQQLEYRGQTLILPIGRKQGVYYEYESTPSHYIQNRIIMFCLPIIIFYGGFASISGGGAGTDQHKLVNINAANVSYFRHDKIDNYSCVK